MKCVGMQSVTVSRLCVAFPDPPLQKLTGAHRLIGAKEVCPSFVVSFDSPPLTLSLMERAKRYLVSVHHSVDPNLLLSVYCRTEKAGEPIGEYEAYHCSCGQGNILVSG